MKFIRIAPHPDLEELIECYWIMENDDPAPVIQKIIPDGFTELVFHYGDEFRTKITGEWQTQSRSLLAGQISSYFYLENTGKAGIIAVKLKPAALTQLFGLPISLYTDKIVDLDTVLNDDLRGLKEIIFPFKNEQSAKDAWDRYFIGIKDKAKNSPVTKAIKLIFSSNGMVSVEEMAKTAAVGERQLERLFKQYVGLTPKYYARIIRFNYIFQLIQSGDISWSEVVYRSGYYDQSHFIRNFKAFTGEDPSAYFFEDKNMANFFLKK